ncbi:MAG: LTA synthase family protein [Succinivibrio sp.]|nr:LTA synthase family protein [Succinivibrio sp.]
MKLFDHSRQSLDAHLKFTIAGVLLGMLVCFVIMLLGRVIFVHSFTAEAVLALKGADLFNFAEKSALFDLKYAAQAFIPVLVCALLFGFSQKLSVFYRTRLFPLLNLAGFLYVLVFTVINYYYYLTYSRIIDLFFFAFLKEDAVATLKTLLEDYPLIPGLAAIIAVSALYLWLFPRAQQRLGAVLRLPQKTAALSAFCVIFVLLFGLCVRGSLGTFPLRQNSAQVSSDPLVNLSVPNGPAALHWAREWAELQAEIPEVGKGDIIKDYAALGIEAQEDDLYAPLELKTQLIPSLEARRPDIVFSVEESMSTHMFKYDDPQKRDLYGALREHFAQDYVFWNFLSEGNGTMDSLTRMLVGVPDLNLSTSMQADRDYVTNAFKLFKEKGYRIVFVTGCIGSWRDMDTYFRSLGVDEIYEQSTLQKWFPDATSFAWGVDDEYMFRGALKVLRERADPRPIFLLTLSISNHPPFRVADGVTPQKIPLTDEELKRFPYPNTTTLFATFRYANDQLGKFISEVKKDPRLADNTVLAVTGDHNMRGIGYTAHPDELALGHAVPFYLYLPPRLRALTDITYDPSRWASQKDIFATIASHALSGATLFSFGCDALAQDRSSCPFPYAYNNDAAVPYEGKYVCDLGRERRFEALSLTGEDQMADPLSRPEAPLCKGARALRALQGDLYYYQARHAPKLPKAK